MSSDALPGFTTAAAALAAAGRRFYSRNWVLGTSGNFSAVISRRPLTLCITRSAAHKGTLAAADFLRIDRAGRVRSHATSRAARLAKPSAETLLHLEILKHRRAAGAILHTHSVCATMVSERNLREGGVTIEGLEMLKGLDGVQTHEHREWVPVVANDQDMPRFASRVGQMLASHPAAHGFLIAGHGLYTWGRTIADAERHVEILEFLLEVRGGYRQNP